jgi:5-methylcytosine-specific restriction endonuclease McrA
MISERAITCSICGIDKPQSEYYTKTKICKVCTRKRRNEYYIANKAKVLLSQKEYRGKNLDKIRERDRLYYLKNKEYFKNRSHEYFLRNRENLLDKFHLDYNTKKEDYKARVRFYYDKNKEIIRPKVRQYRKTTMGRLVHLSNHHKRKAQKLHTANEKLSKHINQLIKDRFFCYWCGMELTGKSFHIDHIYPLSKGGTHTKDNICIACPTCNLKKGNKMPFEFQKQIGKKGQLTLF